MTEKPDQKQKLTDEEVAFLRVAFNLIDENHDGMIDTRELGRLLNRLNMKATDHELDAMMAAQHDPDSKHPKDCLDFKSFVAMMERSKQRLPADFQDEARQLFAAIDRNKDGRISKVELRETLLSMNVKLSNRELDDMFNAADLNRDGYISFDEFTRMVKLVHLPPNANKPEDKMAKQAPLRRDIN